jgi:hypothetical protein
MHHFFLSAQNRLMKKSPGALIVRVFYRLKKHNPSEPVSYRLKVVANSVFAIV